MPPMRAGKSGKGKRGPSSTGQQRDGGGGQGSILNLTEQVVNPTSGAKLATYLISPVGEGPFPALVIVPGGTKEGTRAVKPQEWGQFVEAGFAVVTFDADGRGQSDGGEDYNGTIHQDGLATVISWAASRPEVDGERLGVLSLSYGITMASGALTRHDTSARFLIDWEGPANRTFTAGCNGRDSIHNSDRWGACDDEDYWSQREATTFVPDLTIPYHRVQFTQDHAQPDSESSVAMMQAVQSGECPWTCVNDEPSGEKVDDVGDFVTHPDSRERTDILVRYAVALMEQTTGSKVEPGELPESLKALSAGSHGGGKGGKGKGGKGKRPR